MMQNIRGLPAMAIALLLAGAFVALPGCKKKEKEEARSTEAAAEPEKEKSAARDDNLVATVGDQGITRQELDRELRREDLGPNPNKVQVRNAERRALNTLVERRLVDIAALQEGIEATDEEIERRWQLEVASRGGEEGFGAYLERRRYSREEYREVVANGVLRSRLRDHYFPNVITEEQMREQYKKMVANPGRGEKVRVSRILFKVEGDDEAAWKTAEEKAAAVLAEIRAGMAFTDAATKYSEGPYAKRGGDMGWATDRRRPEEVFGPALTMQAGEIKGPDRVKLGVQVIMVTERKNDSARPFEEERDNIRDIIEGQRNQTNDRLLIERLRSTWRVEKRL
jgi:parvulin-like peptidyl-prolyl isomerase